MMKFFNSLFYKTRRITLLSLSILLVLVVWLIPGCTERKAQDGGEIVKETDNPIPDEVLLTTAINQNCKYILTEWWNGSKDIAFQDSYLPNYRPLTSEQEEENQQCIESFKHWYNESYLQIANWKNNVYSENAILPPSYACRVLSCAIHYGFYDEEATGVEKKEALKKTVLLISSLAKYHCSNSEDGWGHCWQGALWAEMLGMSALLMKDYLSDSDWEMICNMIRSECNYVINVAGVKVYKDRQGQVIEGYTGDSQSETDAWNATILALAIAAMPDDPRQSEWRKFFVELNISAMTCPSDVFSDRVIDGYSFVNSKGSNINEDGTVTNHDKWHIDYMASPIESIAESSIALSFSPEIIKFECLRFNVDKIYKALVDLDLGEFDPSKAGHHFYERTKDGVATSHTNMPGDNEWGDNRQANYYLVDTYCSLIGADNNLEDNFKADKWARCRIVKITEMMKRENSGKIYQDGEENFASGQLYAMACLAQVFSLHKENIFMK